MKLYQQLAQLIQAIDNCGKSGNAEWQDKHCDKAEQLVKDYMPSGSGFDSPTTLDIDASKPNKLVFSTSFHHMDESGGYDGWTEHNVLVTPDLASGFDLRITGRDRNNIKEYIAENFHQALDSDIS